MSSRVKKSFELGVLASTLAVYAAAMGCSGGSGSSPDASANCDVPALLQDSCAGNGCHGGGATVAASLDLISPNVGQRISDLMALSSLDPIVRPGRPEDSVLYDRVQEEPTTGARMPLGGPPFLSDTETSCIRDWIAGLTPTPPDMPDAGPGCPSCECQTFGETETCFSGASMFVEQGICAQGMRTCEAAGTTLEWGSCLEEVIPKPERCDTTDIDEDCDGASPPCRDTWSFALATADHSQAARSVAVDSLDNVYVAGDYTGKIDLGGGIYSSAGAADNVFKDDVFLAKYDKSGNHLWSKSFGDTSTQNATQVIVDSADNVILLGRAFGKIDFGDGARDATGTDDFFVAKFDPDGTVIWSNIFGGIDPDRAERMAVDSGGDVWVAGTFTGTADFGRGPFTSRGIRDGVIIEINGLTGAPRNAFQFGGGTTSGTTKTGDNYGFGIAIYNEGTPAAPVDRVYVAGHFSNTMSFGAGPELTSAGGTDVFVAKLDSAGNHIWSQRFGSTRKDTAYDLVVDPTDGSVVVTGFFQDAINFGGPEITSGDAHPVDATNPQGKDSYDLFLAKLDADGGHVFSAGYGDTADQRNFDTFDNNTWTALDIDASGNIYLGGPLVGVINFGSSPIVSPMERMDAFMAKFDPDGTHVYSARYGDNGTQIGLDIAATNSGHVLLVGRFYSSTMVFDPATGTVRGIGVANGVSSGGDGFVARLVVN
jgi:hypothetical protein